MHRTVTKLFVRDIYLCKFLDFKSIHEHEIYIDILCLCYNVTWLLALFGPFCSPHTALIVPLLLYVHHVNTVEPLLYDHPQNHIDVVVV